MQYVRIVADTIVEVGQPSTLPIVDADGVWWDCRDPEIRGAYIEAAGWLLVVETARPADTDTTTNDPGVSLVAGAPTRTWTERSWTSAELAARTAAANGDTIRARQSSLALPGNGAYLAVATPDAAQVGAQVAALTRQVDALIRLNLGALSDITDTTTAVTATNLVPYPYPWPWTTPGDTDPGSGFWITSLSEIGWSSAPTFPEDGGVGSLYLSYGTGPAAHATCIRFTGNITPTDSSIRVFSAASGTGGIAVTAGISYAVSCLTASEDRVHTVTLGVVWSDSSGSVLSTSTGTPTAQTAIGGDSSVWVGSGSPLWVEGEASLSGTFTAPASAAYARPFMDWDWTSFSDGYMDTASFDFH